MTFEGLGVAPELIQALARQGITAPTAIQEAALPPLLAGTDVYVNAPTGTRFVSAKMCGTPNSSR